MAFSERYNSLRFVAHSNPDRFPMFLRAADRDLRLCRSTLLIGPAGFISADRMAASRLGSGKVRIVWAATVPDKHAPSAINKTTSDLLMPLATRLANSLLTRHARSASMASATSLPPRPSKTRHGV